MLFFNLEQILELFEKKSFFQKKIQISLSEPFFRLEQKFFLPNNHVKELFQKNKKNFQKVLKQKKSSKIRMILELW